MVHTEWLLYVCSVGTILVIPGAILADWILQGYVLPELGALGVVLIIVGFVGFLGSEVIAMKTEGTAVGIKKVSGSRA